MDLGLCYVFDAETRLYLSSWPTKKDPEPVWTDDARFANPLTRGQWNGLAAKFRSSLPLDAVYLIPIYELEDHEDHRLAELTEEIADRMFSREVDPRVRREWAADEIGAYADAMTDGNAAEEYMIEAAERILIDLERGVMSLPHRTPEGV